MVPTVRVRRWRLVRTRSDTLPAAVRQWARRLRHRRRPGQARLVGLVGGLVAVVLAVVVLGTPVLGVRQVEVTGSTVAGADEVRSVAAVRPGTPLARLDTDAVGERVRTIPSVAAVVVRRSWPATVVIDVTERVPVLAEAVAGGFAWVDGEGVGFATTAQRPAGAVLVQLDLARPEDRAPATRAVLRVVLALTAPLRAELRQVVADAPSRVWLELTGGRTIVWGDADDSDRKAQVAGALLGRKATVIDVSSPDVATTR